ncbi:hypothetical protein C9J21_18305 [Photobacterium phosphoreum]|nr:hypothetical protein C9J21_18305 [Photobacterium phosphoreum]
MTKEKLNKLALVVELALLILGIIYAYHGIIPYVSGNFVAGFNSIFCTFFSLFLFFTAYLTIKEIFNSDLNPIIHMVNVITIFFIAVCLLANIFILS